MFHQVEGIHIDTDSFAELKDLIYKIIFDLFGSDTKVGSDHHTSIRTISEVDILSNDGKWLEILGCGIVNPIVLIIAIFIK